MNYAMRACDRLGCDEVAEVRIGWTPASAFRDELETGQTVDRLWFYGCRDHAREVWRQANRNKASPVYSLRR